MRQLILIILTLTLSTITVELLGQIKNPEGQNIFTTEELKTLNTIVDYYDSIILSKTSGNQDIKTSYYQYFDSIFPIVIEAGDLNLLAIDQESRTNFLSSLDQDFLREIYQIRDSVIYSFRGVTKTKYSAYILSLNFNGKFVDYLKYLSNENKFLEQFYDDIIATGDFNPVGYAMILKEYKDLEIEDVQQRLVLVISLLVIDNIEYN